jgi:hypothetical protein
MKIISDERWYLTDDGRRVPERHPLARRLLVSKGAEIDEAELEKYPLYDEADEGKYPLLDQAEGKAINAPPETKAVRGPRKKSDGD